MSSPTSEDLRDFAERVERLCDYILSKTEETKGTHDVLVIEKLKEDAADFQNVTINADTFLYGLDNFMRGHPST